MRERPTDHGILGHRPRGGRLPSPQPGGSLFLEAARFLAGASLAAGFFAVGRLRAAVFFAAGHLAAVFLFAGAFFVVIAALCSYGQLQRTKWTAGDIDLQISRGGGQSRVRRRFA